MNLHETQPEFYGPPSVLQCQIDNIKRVKANIAEAGRKFKESQKIKEEQELSKTPEGILAENKRREQFKISWQKMVWLAISQKEKERIECDAEASRLEEECSKAWKKCYKIKIKTIILETSQKYKIGRKDLLSPSRRSCITVPRFEAMWRIRNEVKKELASFPCIAKVFGMDHTSVLHGIRRYEEMRQGKKIPSNCDPKMIIRSVQ